MLIKTHDVIHIPWCYSQPLILVITPDLIHILLLQKITFFSGHVVHHFMFEIVENELQNQALASLALGPQEHCEKHLRISSPHEGEFQESKLDASQRSFSIF